MRADIDRIITVPIFEYTIHVCVDMSVEEFEKYMIEDLDKKISLNKNHVGMSYVFEDEYGEIEPYTVIYSREVNKGVIAHEIDHAADNILEYLDTPISKDTREIRAYIVQYITDEVYKLYCTWTND